MRKRDEAEVAIHAGLTAGMGWLALALAAPAGTVDEAGPFAVMVRLASGAQWAAVFWLAATAGLVGLSTKSWALQFGSVLVVATAHGVVALCSLLADPLSVGAGVHMVLASLGYFLAWRWGFGSA